MAMTFSSMKIPKVDSAVKKNDKYYPQVFLKDCKYIEK